MVGYGGMVKSDPETYGEAETEARREAALKVMLATPHKPHKVKRERKQPSGSRS